MWELVLQVLSRMLFMVLHVVNSGSFPKPLSAEQERASFAAMRQGDHAARQRLIEHNLRLVAHIIKKYYAGAQNQEDLVSIGTIGLIKAVDTFDETKGSRLATYAARCIENEILMHFRAAKKTAQDVSLSEPIDTDSEGRPLTLMDVLAQEDGKTRAIYPRELGSARAGDYCFALWARRKAAHPVAGCRAAGYLPLIRQPPGNQSAQKATPPLRPRGQEIKERPQHCCGRSFIPGFHKRPVQTRGRWMHPHRRRRGSFSYRVHPVR